jgi:hypothetical protein
MQLDIAQATQRAAAQAGIVNVPALAEEIRRRNETENVALEDIEYEVLFLAQRLSVAIEFNREAVGVSVPMMGGGLPMAALNAPPRD